MSERDLITVLTFALGSEIAVVVSWSAHHSVLWAAFHGFFGWLYVGFHVLFG